MNDAELIAYWKTIKEPSDALAEIVKHQMFLGSDPYYRDLNNGLIEMAERIVEEME